MTSTFKIVISFTVVIIVLLIVALILILVYQPYCFSNTNGTALKLPHTPNPNEFFYSMIATVKDDKGKNNEYPHLQLLSTFHQEDESNNINDEPKYFIGLLKENKNHNKIILSLPNQPEIVAIEGLKSIFNRKNAWTLHVIKDRVRLFFNNIMIYDCDKTSPELFSVNEIQINNTAEDIPIPKGKFWHGRLYESTTGTAGNRKTQKHNGMWKIKQRFQTKKKKSLKSEIISEVTKQALTNL